MTVTAVIQFLAVNSLFQLDILAWIVGIPMLIALCVYLVRQAVRSRRLKAELNQLDQVKTLSVEYELVLKAMHLCVWRIDVDSHVVSFDSDYRDYGDIVFLPSGGKVEDIIRHILPEYQEDFRKGMDDVMNGVSEQFNMQYQIMSPHSQKPYWSESFFTVEKRNLNGDPETIVGTTMRIDQQKDIETALMDALYHAEESDRLKSAFLSNISHEIRTPLNAIVGFSNVLSMAHDEEERQKLVDVIQQNNTRLLSMLDNIVSMSRLEAKGAATLNKETFALKGLFFELFEKYHEKARSNGDILQIEDDNHLPTLHTDRERLLEIVNQYLDNALKYTTHGLITVGCKTDDNVIRIFVRDTGKGIAADKCNERLFERFFKVDEFEVGSGLGLSICRSLAASLDGRVGVVSELGKGSTFWVELGKDIIVYESN